jgi:tol-pal system protein YbgF
LKKQRLITVIVTMLLLGGTQSAFGVSKETVQMMQQLDQLQQAVQNLQKTLDTQTAVLKTLIEQATDNVNTMKVTIDDLRGTMQQNLAATNARFDTMTTQMQALSESLDEAKARLSKLSDQMAQTQNILQTLPPAGGTQPPGTNPANPPGTVTPPPNPVPDADSLYNAGLSYYNGGQYPLAVQSFQDYLKYYGESDRASNAQFYIGDCYYSQKNYEQAIEEYNKCIERYPTGNKAAAAQLKKGYALLALEQKSAGVKELRSLIQRFPEAPEAALARQRLRQLGITVPPHKKS